jgi:hypothetical protein
VVSRQAITIGADGSVSGLQVKPGKGFDLRCLGKAIITRASEVEWCEARQLWFVTVKEGRYAGFVIDQAMTEWAGLSALPAGCERRPDNLIMAGEYDDAVRLEIAVLDGLRLKGLLS